MQKNVVFWNAALKVCIYFYDPTSQVELPTYKRNYYFSIIIKCG